MLPSRLRAVAMIVTAIAVGAVVGACASEPQPGDRGGKITPLSCPTTFSGTAPWVPRSPQGIDGGRRMVPQQPPSKAMICAYTGHGEDPVRSPLTGTRQLDGRLTELAVDLTWLPRRPHGAGYACAGVGLSEMKSYLLGLTYPTGSEWVSSTADGGDCTATSNGRFTSQINISAQLAASYRAATWAPIPPHNGTGHDPCATGRSGRLGEDERLVPGQPTSILLCAGTSDPRTTTYVSATRNQGFQLLVDALNALHTRPTTSGCQGDGRQITFYELLAHYQKGPDVLVRIDPHCAPAIDNRSLQSATADTVVPLLEQILPPR